MNMNDIEDEVERIINTHTAVVTKQLLDEIDTEFEKINPKLVSEVILLKNMSRHARWNLLSGTRAK